MPVTAIHGVLSLSQIQRINTLAEAPLRRELSVVNRNRRIVHQKWAKEVSKLHHNPNVVAQLEESLSHYRAVHYHLLRAWRTILVSNLQKVQNVMDDYDADEYWMESQNA